MWKSKGALIQGGMYNGFLFSCINLGFGILGWAKWEVEAGIRKGGS